MQKDAFENMLLVVKAARLNKYVPHQNQREMRRRLRQIRDYHLREARGGAFISEEARYAAFGLVSPDQLNLTGQ